MSQHLLLSVHLHGGRYHGQPEWPPAPARLFQALIAGTARGTTLPANAADALRWLESLAPPTIGVPRSRLGRSVDIFVPNNDLDAKGGDPQKVADIRTKKSQQPWLLEGDPSFHFAWPLDEDPGRAEGALRIADELYQFGRGIDMAWATGAVVDDAALAAALGSSELYVPSPFGSGTPLPCPALGTLASLCERHASQALKLRRAPDGKTLFHQPPKARFRAVSYALETGGHRFVFELRDRTRDTSFFPWKLDRVVELVEAVRDGAERRLREAFPESEAAIIAMFRGKAAAEDGAPNAPRLQIVPLPSIGHIEVDPGIRRILLMVPLGSPLAAEDVAWAFSGLSTISSAGEPTSWSLVRGADLAMARRYGAEALRWRTVTPVAFPGAVARRRIDPRRLQTEAKASKERSEEEERAMAALRDSLRHAGIRQRVRGIRLQREPFGKRGARAEAFAEGTRFAKERLWHVDLEFTEALRGGLVVGDGRYLGLGVFAPVTETDGLWSFRVMSGLESADPVVISRATRRAVMARVQAEFGKGQLPGYFSGHDLDGQPLRSEKSAHLAFHWDAAYERILIIAPHWFEHREPLGYESEHLRKLDAALRGFAVLRAGRCGRLSLEPCPIDDGDYLLGASQRWGSVTPYEVTRHVELGSVSDALAEDLWRACRRHGLPVPQVSVSSCRAVRGRGLSGHLLLEFDRPVAGPLILGKSRFLGGGLFGRVR